MGRRIIPLLLIILVLIPYASAASVIDESQPFLNPAIDYTNEVPQEALLLAALASTVGKTVNTSVAAATVLDAVNTLESWQNPDGGWGYYRGSISTPQDTALAIIGLTTAKPVVEKYAGESAFNALDASLRDGRAYLLGSFEGKGWGYIKDSPIEFYPTVLSLWALGELGLNINNSLVVDSASDYVANFTDLSPDYLALRLIAFKAIGHKPVEGDLQRCSELLGSGNLSGLERAMLTYALVLYEPFGFDTAKALTVLEEEGQHNGTYFILSGSGAFLNVDSLTPTAYAVMAFSLLADELSKGTFTSPKSVLCSELIKSQNPDGGWGIYAGGASSAKATYYAVEALHYCTPLPEDVKKGIAWAREHLESAEDNALRAGTITEDYYYTVLTLARFGNLSDSERAELINFTRSLEYAPGQWRGLFSIPQPYETAMGLSLLQALGDRSSRDVTAGKKWLLSLTKGGWGIILNPLFGVMTAENVPTTVMVLEALSNVSTPEELKPHLDWLLSQRLPDGAWGYFRESTNMLGQVFTGTPSVEYTARAAFLLESFGYNVMPSVINWTLKNLNLTTTTVDKALALELIRNVKIIPEVSIYEVINTLSSGMWEVNYLEPYANVASVIGDAVSAVGATVELKEGSLDFEEGNHIVLAPFGSFNVSNYNSGLSVVLSGNQVIINGRAYPETTTILIAPGRTQNGYVLAVLFDPKNIGAVETIFSSGMFKYLHGNYLILRASDINGDGKIEPNEIIPLVAG